MASLPRLKLMIKMIALRKTYYGGVDYKKGETFEVQPRYVAILTACGSAKRANPETEEPKKGAYKRRDLRAEK